VGADGYGYSHALYFDGFGNQQISISGPSNLVSTADAAGLSVTLVASNYPTGGTFQWSTTSQNIQFQGSTTGSSVVVAPIQGHFTPKGGTEVLTLICVYGGGSITNTFKMIVQRPTSLNQIRADATTQNNRVTLKVRYQILDQNGQPLRPVVRVGNANVRIANLKASETLAWQCNTFCTGAQTETHDLVVPDDGTFQDTQAAPTSCGSYVRSQNI
jgi:hypothetical protein